MFDCRLPQNRLRYFSDLYAMNMRHGVMPGLVYLYMPALKEIMGWEREDVLWFAFLNGLTQNPITSLRLFQRLPVANFSDREIEKFDGWFNDQWKTLQFDVDRRYQKKDTVKSCIAYKSLVSEFGSQERMLTGKTFNDLWNLVTSRYVTFGRLSSFSYLEYVYLNGFGADCDDLLFDDRSGSRSHRNGMLLLLGRDDMVWDNRMRNGFSGNYDDLRSLAVTLQSAAKSYVHAFGVDHPELRFTGFFTLESNLCTFKNHFFGRRYPGVYADMAWDRITWADERGQQESTELFKMLRSTLLPDWLRAECEPFPLSMQQKASVFPSTGLPYRAEWFLPYA